MTDLNQLLEYARSASSGPTTFNSRPPKDIYDWAQRKAIKLNMTNTRFVLLALIFLKSHMDAEEKSNEIR